MTFHRLDGVRGFSQFGYVDHFVLVAMPRLGRVIVGDKFI
jgi:hypothetical protein